MVSRNHFVHEMRHMNDSFSSCTEFLDKSHNVISMNNVKSCGRFVKNEDLGFHDQCARDGHALLLAAREHLRIFGSKLGESPKFNLLFYQRCYLIARYLEILQTKGNIVCDHAADNLVLRILEDQSKLRTNGLVCLKVNLAVIDNGGSQKGNGSLVRGGKAREN